MSEFDENREYTANQIACKIQYFFDSIKLRRRELEEEAIKEEEDVEKRIMHCLISTVDCIVDEYWELFDEMLTNK